MFTDSVKLAGSRFRSSQTCPPCTEIVSVCLVEVLQNLLDNAAKFMGGQTTPLIEIGQRGGDDGKPIFFVKDNGMGIPPEHHERIFGIFNKLDPKAEGTGIGLSLGKRNIEAHGGRIWVESETGKGSTFYFTMEKETQNPDARFAARMYISNWSSYEAMLLEKFGKELTRHHMKYRTLKRD